MFNHDMKLLYTNMQYQSYLPCLTFKREKSQLSPCTWRKHHELSFCTCMLSANENFFFWRIILIINILIASDMLKEIECLKSILLIFWIIHIMQCIYFRLSALPLWLKCSTRRSSSVIRNQRSLLLWLEQAIWIRPLHQKSSETLSDTEGWPQSPGGIPTQNRPFLIYQRRTGNACMQTNPSLSPQRFLIRNPQKAWQRCRAEVESLSGMWLPPQAR